MDVTIVFNLKMPKERIMLTASSSPNDWVSSWQDHTRLHPSPARWRKGKHKGFWEICLAQPEHTSQLFWHLVSDARDIRGFVDYLGCIGGACVAVCVAKEQELLVLISEP